MQKNANLLKEDSRTVNDWIEDARKKEWENKYSLTEDNKGMYVWIDGSANKERNEAGTGVYYREGSKMNYAFRVIGKQDNNLVELLGLEYALRYVPPNKGMDLVRIITDSKYVKKMLGFKKIDKATKGEILKMENRGGSIENHFEIKKKTGEE